tara:strand:+ start:931 stop:1164 length:234 start_codon:yes stop_codon:yes gene_type:complete
LTFYEKNIKIKHNKEKYMSTTNQQLLTLFDEYKENNDKFAEKGNKAAGTRARKALSEMTKLAKVRRKEIQEAKTVTA